ncbi:MAG TPA: RpiB/LacA/LacB family sugar-phosphate isomerase, partial [Candidatus Polarisedimenticolia bacterium]|nr:RpiB/LacA/LacB family sugar-phosphate isomerase [Candidatus Polarisedimenticolia bacterium]
KVALASDHAGFDLKGRAAEWIRAAGHELIDRGPDRFDPDDDYPDAAAAVGRAVVEGVAERGIVICGSGVGAAVAANKIRGVRAGLCHDTYSARQGVEHDDINVLCLGSRVVGEALAQDLIASFLGARFSGETRHRRRLGKIEALERGGT